MESVSCARAFGDDLDTKRHPQVTIYPNPRTLVGINPGNR